MHTAQGEARVQNNPAFEPFSPLFDEERSTQIDAAMRERRLSLGCAYCREVGHVGVLLLCPPNLAKEASSDQSFDCCATFDDPIELT